MMRDTCLNASMTFASSSPPRVSRSTLPCSRQYVQTAYRARSGNNVGVMFLCEAALGKEHSIMLDDCQLTSPPQVSLRKLTVSSPMLVLKSCVDIVDPFPAAGVA